MSKQIVVSNSSLTAFKDCKRKFWLSHYRKLRPQMEKTTGALALGSRVHLALEKFYDAIMEGKTVEEADITTIWMTLVDMDRMTLLGEGLLTDDLDKEAELGRIMLEGYVEWLEDEGYIADLEVISQEEMLSHEFFDGRIKLVGKIDQRVRRKADGARLVVDYKTTAQLSMLEETIQQNRQFLTYMLLELLQENDPSQVSGALIVALKKNKRTAAAKPPFYAAYEVSHNVFELRNFFNEMQGQLLDVIRFWDRLDAGEDHHVVAYPSPSRDCSWKCEFAKFCPMFDDGSDVERALSDHFYEGDPFDYYGDASPTSE